MGGRTLGDYFALQRGTTYKSQLLGRPGPLLLGLATIYRNGGFRTDSLQTYGGDSPDRLLVQAGELYLSLKDVTQSADLLGAVARLPHGYAPGRLTQDTVKLTPRRPDVPLDYLYWVLRTPQYRTYCRSHATGTTNLGLAREDFLSFPVPERTPGRERIVQTLSALEDKIDLNRRMSETLDQMVRVLFEDSIAGSADGGWQVGRLGDVADQVRRGVEAAEIAPSTPYIALEHMPKRNIALAEWDASDGIESNKNRFSAGDILFGKLRPYFHKVGVAPVDGVCSTDIVVVAPKRPSYFGFVLGHVSSDAFVAFTDAGSTGTKMPRTSWTEMSRYEVAVPSEAQAAAFTATVRPLVQRVVVAVHENRTLIAVRDALLPKLLSGEIRVRAAESAAAAVL